MDNLRSRLNILFRLHSGRSPWRIGVLLIPALILFPDFARAGFIERFVSKNPEIQRVYLNRIRAAAGEAGLRREIALMSPTFIAMNGLLQLFDGHIAEAEKTAERLVTMRRNVANATFFIFDWSYTTTWPYKLEAPWISSLAQGFALSLFSELAQRTGDHRYQDIAAQVAASYKLPIENGGFARWDMDAVHFEEYPLAIPTYVLNGGAIATLALIDYTTYFNDQSLSELVKAASRWWSRNIARYDFIGPSYPEPVSAYSLAPKRAELELLFRFLSGTKVDVQKIELLVDGQVIRSLNVGMPFDDDQSKSIYLWSNPQFMNWGTIQWDDSGPYRTILPSQGQYDHAPFSVMIENPSAGNVSVRVAARNEGSGAADLQVYDGKQYWRIGQISPGTNFDKEVEFPVISVILEPVRESLSRPQIDPAYFWENAALTSLLGDALDNKTVWSFAQRWMTSAKWTPARFDARGASSMLQQPSRQPVLGKVEKGVESVHVEYPSVIESGDVLFMFYAGYGDDKRWRLFLATSTDGGVRWVRQGGILDERQLPFTGSYAFPAVTRKPNGQGFLLYFSVDSDGDGKYDGVWAARSDDLWDWKIIGKVISDSALDPVVWMEQSRLYMNYTVIDGANSHTVIETFSDDGEQWSAGQSIFNTRSNHAGFYTIARVHIDDYPLWVLDTKTPGGDFELRLLCRGPDNKLFSASDEPMDRSESLRNLWDSHIYGMNFLQRTGELWMYYNGINLTDALGGTGQIGRALVDRDRLSTILQNSSCRKSLGQ